MALNPGTCATNQANLPPGIASSRHALSISARRSTRSGAWRAKPERDTTAHGYTGEAGPWQAEAVKEWSQECGAFGRRGTRSFRITPGWVLKATPFAPTPSSA